MTAMAATAAADPRAPRMTLQAIADALEPGLLLVEELAERCAAEPVPSTEYVSGLLANVMPERRAAHERVVEELGLLSVEDLLARVQ